MTGASGGGAGRPTLTDEQAARKAARIIEVALSLKRGCGDAELLRLWGLSRRQAVALVEKRQRHPAVVAYLGDSVEALQIKELRPRKRLLEAAARLALALVDADERRTLTGAPGEQPRLTLTAAIQIAALRVRVDREVNGVSDPAKNIPKRTAVWNAVGVDVSGVRREVNRIMNGERN